MEPVVDPTGGIGETRPRIGGWRFEATRQEAAGIIVGEREFQSPLAPE